MSTLITASHITPIARAGLIAKGIVYTLLGAFAFMAAADIGNQSARTGKEDVLSTLKQQTGGQIMLALLALGLVCYSIWRIVQCLYDTEDKGNDIKGIAIRGRYLFSGAIYGSLALYAGKLLFAASQEHQNRQGMIQTLLSKPFGDWVLGSIAIAIFGTGVYQCYYGLSEKYRKHINSSSGSANKNLLLMAGKGGYTARGIVWMIIGWLFMKAAIHANSSEAGDTSKAFSFLKNGAYGSYLLGAVALGLVFYGIFNFIRARHETFNA